MIDHELFLHEEVLLLALDDDRGTVEMGSYWQQAAGGAIVAELLLAGRIRTTEDKKPRLEVIDSTPLGNPVLDEVLTEMAAAKKPRTGAAWVGKLGGRGGLKERIAADLVRQGVLKQEQGKVLWIFNQTRYPERDGRPEKEVVARLRRAIFTATADLTPRTVVLVSLADSAGLLSKVFDKKRLKERKSRIKKIVEGEIAGSMARDAVQAMQAAVMVACIMPAIVTTTVAT